MSVLYIMIPISLLLGLAFLAMFIWSNESGQYDDLVTPAHRILDTETNNNEVKDNESGEV